jgi:hypothetical protein
MMFGTPGIQGGYIGNAGGLMAGLDLPFGGGNQYRQIQKENQPGAPKPTGTSPTRVFPPNAPGREGAIDVQFRQALGGFSQMGNMGGLISQINPTYPAGDPRYGQPMIMGGAPMSMNPGEYNWTQTIRRLREQNPAAYEKVKGMMGPYGWQKPPAGFQVPAGI